MPPATDDLALAPPAPRTPWWTLFLVLALALGQRIAVHQQVASGPIPQLHAYGESDMAFHHAQAQALAAGGWLQWEPSHPLHAWHGEVARVHFAANPAAAARYAGAPNPTAALWNDWYGGTRYHQEPLYPYVVAFVYRLAGPDPGWMLALQLVLGAAIQVLLFLIARRHAGGIAAWGAVLLSAAYAPSIAHELVLLRTALEVFAALATVALADRAMDRGRARDWLVAGASAGLAVTCRAPLAILALGAGALAVRAGRRKVAAYAIGAMLALTPLALRNLAVGAPIAGLSSVATVTFVCQNLPGIDPLAGFSVDAPAVAAVMGTSEGAFFPAARGSWARHPNAWSVVRMLAGRALALVADREVSGNTCVELARRESAVIAWCPLGFGALTALAAIGALLPRESGRRPWTLLALVVATVVPQLAFYSASRFRAPLAMALLPFAGAGLLAFARDVRARRWTRLGAACGVALAVVLVARLSPDERRLSAAELATAHEVHHLPAWSAATLRGDQVGAAAVAEAALALGAPERRALEAETGPLRGEARDHAIVADGWWTRLARARALAGDSAGARSAIDEAARLEERLARPPLPDVPNSGVPDSPRR